jgi:hypothetical protein
MLTEYDQTWCSKLLTDLMKWPISSPFHMPVDPVRDGALNYPSIVKNPMDFHTMKKKLTGSEYNSVQEFIDDIQLSCDNAKLFNGSASMYGLICDDIMAEAHRQYSEKPKSADEEWHRGLLKAVQNLGEHLGDAPAEIAVGGSPEAPPSLEKLQPSEQQREALMRIVGTCQTEILSKSWGFLNVSTRDHILSVIGDSMV